LRSNTQHFLKLNTKNFQALIFDLGGVIIDLKIDNTITAFANLSGIDKQTLVEQYWNHDMFHKYERGHIPDDEFRAFLREFLSIEASENQLDEAWNSMILDIPHERLKMLDKLKESHEVFLLSNTNDIHLRYVNDIYVPLNNETLDDHFHGAYYSNHVGMRKPDAEIFEKVIEDNKLDPSKTLFLDDNKQNIEGAAAVGLNTFRVDHPDQLKTLFNE